MQALEITPENTALAAADDLFALWRAHLASQVDQGDISPTTAATYRAGVRKFAEWVARAGISHPLPQDVARFKAAMLKDAKPTSVNVWLCGVRSFYTWCVESGRMPVSPAAGVRGAKRRGANQSHKRDALTQGEAVRLLALPLPKRDAAMIALKLYAGVRDVEVSRADLADLRTKEGMKVLFVTGKGHTDADAYVKITRPCETALAAWLVERGPQAGPLFTSASDRNKGGRLSLSAIRAIVKTAFHLAGITEATKTSHSTRHTAITTAIRRGANPLQVQAMARHAKLDTTMIYFHEESRLANPAEDFISYDAGQ